jgi:hypothetical protein
LEKEYPFLSGFTSSIKSEITRVATFFIEDTSDEEKLRSMVFEKDFENRD